MKIINREVQNYKYVIVMLFFVTTCFLLSFSNQNTSGDDEMVVIHTAFGDMVVELYDDTPVHKANFLKLAKEAYYDSLLFHRVIEGFMIQGGDPQSKNAKAGMPLGNGGPGYTLPAEFHTKYIHKKGALSAARQGDNVNPNKESSGSQFYIVQGKPVSQMELESIISRKQNIDTVGYSKAQVETYKTLGGTPHLDGGYTVFGEVVEGMNVLDSIAAQPVDARSRPLQDITMSVQIVKR